MIKRVMSSEDRLNNILEWLQSISQAGHTPGFGPRMRLGVKKTIEKCLKELRDTKKENERLKAELQEIKFAIRVKFDNTQCCLKCATGNLANTIEQPSPQHNPYCIEE